MTKESIRYTSPYMSVKLVKEEHHIPLFPKINVQLIPQPEPISLCVTTAGGDLTSTYDPAPLIGNIIGLFAWMHCPPVTVLSEYMNKYRLTKSEAREVLSKLFCDRVQMCVETACNYTWANIQPQLEYALVSLLNDSNNRAFAERNGQAFKVEPIEGLIKPELRGFSKRQRQVVKLSTRGGKRNFKHDWSDEDCINLARRYEQLHKSWRLAKRLFKESPLTYAQDIEDSLLFLPEDLVKKLADDDPYISSESNLAVESAARVIGINPGLYNSVRQLHRYRKRGKDLLAKRDFWKVKTWL